jgi:hypothetical protein
VSRKNKKRATPRPSLPELNLDDLTAIVEKAASSSLGPDDLAKLRAAIETLAFLKAEWQARGTSIKRLLRIIFGAPTEKTRAVLGQKSPPPASSVTSEPPGSGADEAGKGAPNTALQVKRKGHGRNSVAAFTGANRVTVTHPWLASGEGCPDCTGKVYPLAEPSKLVRITGMGPLSACVYECERMRCNLCGEVYTAPAPEGVGDEKYDESATAMIALLKYGTGLPFNRIEKLQAGMGIPMPAATQWDLVSGGGKSIAIVHERLIEHAANGDVVYNDDTTMQILKLTHEQRAKALSDDEAGARTGVFTSGIVATGDGHKIALFFTGPRHAGENLTEVLKRRTEPLPPIQMCDGLLSWNLPDKPYETQNAQCLSHGRRSFVDQVENFPEEVAYVLNAIREVYKTDDKARDAQLTPEQRLKVHQDESGPRMEALEKWMQKQFDERTVEPNSGLGEAIKHLQKHWTRFTLFLRVPGAPLDNNICEQALKKAILHRKNALFYRTLNGAAIGDRFMSLIHTAELAGVNPFDYLVTLLRYRDALGVDPDRWLPWNYQSTVAFLSQSAQRRASPGSTGLHGRTPQERAGGGPDPPA